MKKMIVFTVGAVGYPLIEIMWRGFSHWTMEFAGGICFLAIYILNEKNRGASLLKKCVLGSCIITGVELTVGMIVNKLLHWNVWNYSRLPFNLMGQICLPYSLLWFLLTIPLIYLCRLIDRIFQKASARTA